MHEWALAESVVETVLKVSKKENLNRVSEIKVKLGVLQQIEEDIFRSALKDITASCGAVFEGVNIKLDKEEAVFKCRRCGYVWKFTDSLDVKEENQEDIHFVPEVVHVYMRCPSCKSFDFEVVRGRGVSIDYVEGE